VTAGWWATDPCPPRAVGIVVLKPIAAGVVGLASYLFPQLDGKV
jgi:hypothetical protein